GTTAGGTTVTGATSALDLNGYTLATTEALTLSGALATGALQNTSSSAVDYSGLITLGAASTIISNYGDINITNTGNITGNTFALTIGGAGNGSLSSNLNTTSGTLTKNGLGRWTIYGGASTYTGLTTISAGTIKLGSTGSGSNTPFGTVAGGITISDTGILDLNGLTLATAEPIGSIRGTGIAGIGAFINTSNNTVSYSGPITLAASSRIANYGSGTFTLSGNISGSSVLTIVSVGNFTQATNSIMSGALIIVKEGSGLLVLSGQNTFTSSVTVSTGTLRLGASGGATNTPLGTNAGGVVVASGAVLDLATYSLGGASTYETLTLSGTGIKDGGALISSASGDNNFGAMLVSVLPSVINSGSGLIAFRGTITASASSNLTIGGSGPTTISGVYGAAINGASLTKKDSGTLIISAASITTGLVRVNGGTLQYGVNDALSTPAVTVAGGTLNLAGFNETNIGAVTLIDGSIINSGGAATLTSTASYTVERGTISAVLGSAVASGLTKTTAGRFIMSGNNTFTSTSITVNAGYVKLGHSNSLGASGTASTTTINGGATLELEGGITIPSTKAITVHGTGFNNSGAIRNISGSNSIGANITLGSTNVRINSDSGALSFPTISGNTFNSIFGGTGDVSVTGVIGTTSGTLTKDGSGNLTLTGSNTYTGATTLIGGTLFANATNAIGTGVAANTLVFNGGILQATGTITSPVARAVTLMSGGGTINTNGNDMSIAGTVGSAGSLTKSGAGTLTITGATTIGGDLNISAGTFVPPASITINGDFNNNGTYTHNNGTVIFSPVLPDLTTSITGSSNTTFYNLTNTTPNSTLTFKAGNTYTISNVLTLTGSEGNPIFVNSDTPASQWFMTLSGSASASHLKVKDSGCIGGNNVSASGNIYDYGNNGSCWSFIIIHYGGGGGGHVELSATPDADVTGGAGGGEGGAGATTAIGTVVTSANVVQSVTIDSGGSGYLSAPTVLFCGGGGSGALGTAVLSGDSVSSVTVDNGGSGYTTDPTIVFDSSCPVSGGSGGGGGSTGDLGFFYNSKRVFAFWRMPTTGSFYSYLFY
ncbi:MAG: autotransporter-associated beta strand repeat-containing protein, partial [Candidatus Pacebacteria bacterium]|nr:autotransporter-associated beta strand repeat-containing protein [Candidatus Paceibacterota bacterium]